MWPGRQRAPRLQDRTNMPRVRLQWYTCVQLAVTVQAKEDSRKPQTGIAQALAAVCQQIFCIVVPADNHFEARLFLSNIGHISSSLEHCAYL